jgi:hypothetical protein
MVHELHRQTPLCHHRTKSLSVANVVQQDRTAQREHASPRCGAEPGKSCWEKARGNPRRKMYLARPHAEEPSWSRRDMD